MKRALFFAILWIAAASAAFGATRIIPVAAHLPGANGTVWATDVSLRNESGAAMTIELVFHANDGITRSRPVTLGAGESVLLEDAAAPAKFPGTNPASWLGQLEIRAPGAISASAYIYTRGANGGTFGSTYEAVDAAVLSDSGALVGLVNNARFRSNVAFSNASGEAIAITWSLRDAAGAVVLSRTLDLPPYAVRQISLSDSGTAAESPLSLFWSATGDAYVVASVIDNRSGDPTSAPSMSRDVTSLFYPLIGRTPGANGTFWSTSASVAGTSGVAASVTLAYTDMTTGRTYTRTALLPPHGNISTEDVHDFVGAPAGAGSLLVSSTAPVVAVMRVFTTRDDGSTFGASVLAQDDVVRSTAVTIEAVRRDRDYRLNVALANRNAASADGTVRLLDERGTEIESEPFHVAPGKSAQIAMPGVIDVRAGTLRIEASNGMSVTAVASNIDNVTGDSVQREAEQESERQSELEIAMDTRTAPIGVPISFSLKRAGSGVVAAQWQFGDGTTASGAAVTHAWMSAGEFDVTVDVTLAGGAVVRDREDVRITGIGQVPLSSSIDFSYTPSAPAPGEQVVFTATGSTGGGVFKWKFPGDIRPIGSTVTFTFPSAGSFEVEVEIEHGATRSEITRTVVVGGASNGTPGVGPIDFTFSPASPRAGQEVTFTASGATGGGMFKWKFPGDVRKLGNPVSFVFPADGAYEVEVEVEHGAVAEITKIVTVGAGSPVPPGSGALSFTFSPQSPAVGQEVTFTASGDTGGGVYKWKFPGDVRKLGPVVTFAFTTAGVHSVELEVEHGTIVAEVTRTVTVGGGGGNPQDPPTTPLDFTFSPAAPAAGQVVTFTASGSTFGGTYKWKFPGDVRMTGAVVTFTFAAAGSYEVELEIEDGSVVAEITKVVTVSGGGSGGPAPAALNFTWFPASPRVGQLVTFTATGETGGGTYEWRFPGDVRKSGSVVTFTFAVAGSHEVQLEVEHGIDAKVEKIVTVSP